MMKTHKVKKITAVNTEQRKILAENLADTYFRLIQTIDTYFQDPITRDETLNHYYLTLCKTVRQLLSQALIPELNAYYNPFGTANTADGDKVKEVKSFKKVIPELGTPYYEPFSSLFLAKYEMEKHDTNISKVLNALQVCYEKLNTFISPINKSKTVTVNFNELDKYLSTLKHQKSTKLIAQEPETRSTTTFTIKVNDRQIWINNYLLSKPHAVGRTLEFFEYIRSQPANTQIENNTLPYNGSLLDLKIKMEGTSFIKMLNELGFKGEILKAYFPKRGKNLLVYRGDVATAKDLERAGINMPVFTEELKLAHLKNSPK